MNVVFGSALTTEVDRGVVALVPFGIPTGVPVDPPEMAAGVYFLGADGFPYEGLLLLLQVDLELMCETPRIELEHATGTHGGTQIDCLH